ncbi:hypothetical protein [Ferirhizobium litorale]|nr:hypothetical protein [Fererhizobium litorale]
MFLTLTMLAALISIMFVTSVASTISALREEREQVRAYIKNHRVF